MKITVARPSYKLNHLLIVNSIIKPNISSLSINNTVYIVFISGDRPDILGFMKRLETPQIFLRRRIRSLRNTRGWTQEQLGAEAGINYKFLGEIERGQQNPSFNVLVKIADALGVELMELFRLESEISDRKEIEGQITRIIKNAPNDALRQIFLMLKTLYPIH